MMTISVITNISVFRFYGYIKNIEKISVDIFSQISVERKWFKIYRNAWKTPKNDKISKNSYFLSYFVNIIDINMIKNKNIGK